MGARLRIPFWNGGLQVFQIWEYLHINYEISWGWDPNLKHEIHLCFIYALNILPESSLNNVFSSLIFWLWPITWGQVWNLQLGVPCCTWKFQILEHLGFWVRDTSN
jgi:hypothetical protein